MNFPFTVFFWYQVAAKRRDHFPIKKTVFFLVSPLTALLFPYHGIPAKQSEKKKNTCLLHTISFRFAEICCRALFFWNSIKGTSYFCFAVLNRSEPEKNLPLTAWVEKGRISQAVGSVEQEPRIQCYCTFKVGLY